MHLCARQIWNFQCVFRTRVWDRVGQSKKRASSGHQKKVGGRCPQTRTFVSKPRPVHTLFRPTYTQKFVSEVGLQTLLNLTWVFPVYTDVGKVGFPLSMSDIVYSLVKEPFAATRIENLSVSVDCLLFFGLQ